MEKSAKGFNEHTEGRSELVSKDVTRQMFDMSLL